MQHGSYSVLCFVMAMVCFSQAKRAAPAGRIGAKGDPGPRYCPIDAKTTKYLKQVRKLFRKPSRGPKGQRGSVSRKITKKNLIKWPFDCRHFSYDFLPGTITSDYKPDVYDCCRKCDIPNFQDCVHEYIDDLVEEAVEIRCGSDAIRCIAKCLCNTNGGKGAAGKPGRPGPKAKCAAKLKLSKGSYCKQRTCIRV